MKLLKKIRWLWKRFFGTLLIIKVSDELKEDEILIYGHSLYLPPNSILSKNDK
jgi:hypothetical protein